VASDPSIPINNNCYTQCIQQFACSYDTTKSLCTRGAAFQNCCDACKTNTTPVTPICAHKTACDCLGDTANTCGWCQVQGTVTDKTTNTATPYVWGYCAPPSGTNTCSAPTATGGTGGSFCTVAPTACDDSSVDPTIKDTSTSFTDPKLQTSFSKINDGTVSATAMQNTLGIGCNITILRVLKASAVDNVGTISTMIVVNSNPNGLSNDQLCKCVTDCYVMTADIPSSNIQKCQLLDYSDTDAGTSAKRATTSGQYIQTAVVDPSTSPSPSSAGTLAPIWMMLFAILFFRL